jgi:steroid delta-isomerase-like uncharacterized protein
VSESSALSSPLEPLADRWRTAWAGGSFAACCTPDVQYEDPLAHEPLRGAHALEGHAAALRRALPDVRLERSASAVQDGDFGCVPWRILGTQRGPVGGLPPTGRFLVLHGVHYLELTDGLVRRARGFFDLYDAGIQLGLLPARGSLSETALLMLRGYGLRPRS